MRHDTLLFRFQSSATAERTLLVLIALGRVITCGHPQPKPKLATDCLFCFSENTNDGKFEAPLETERKPESPLSSQKSIRLLSWNIDGLNTKFTVERANCVCDIIESRRPDVVFIQEIVPQTWTSMTSRLAPSYHFYRDQVSFHYYHIMLVRKGSAVNPLGDLEVLRFPGSSQGRHLLQLSAKFHSIQLRFMTSHLESLNHYTVERKKQLATVLGMMDKLRSDSVVSIFGGDMNVMEREVKQVGIPSTIGDVWEECGAESSCKCTWESSDPLFRLDRLYVCPKECNLVPKKFELVGRDLVPECGMPPSDHLGLWVEFVLVE